MVLEFVDLPVSTVLALLNRPIVASILLRSVHRVTISDEA
jgi:hypothetical protein